MTVAMVRVAGLRKTFHDTVRGDLMVALESVTLEVPDRQFLSLLGPSGCGKTTLIRLIAGLIDASAGEISVAGKPVKGAQRQCAMVFQNYGLLPWRTVIGNVELGLEIRHVAKAERRTICSEYIERVGLGGFENYYPHQISGGMQQRTALARALSKNPKVLLMDEPFAAVDMQTRERLQDELLRIWEKFRTTVLFVTHSIEESIYLGDRVIVMGARPGRVVADIPIDLPRPRDSASKTDPRFGAYCAQVRSVLMKAAQRDGDDSAPMLPP